MSLTPQIKQHLQSTFDEDDIRQLAHQFSRNGFVKIPDIVSESLKAGIHQQAYQLLDEHAERRDITLATTDHTPRYLSVVHSETVSTHGHTIRECSESPALLDFLGRVAGEELLLDVKPDEKFVITKQQFKGDTHGWHWGDYAFALIWLVEVPPLECGGMLQCVPHTSWNKDKPLINHYLCEHPIHTYSFQPGDVYFLRADTTLHRTVPLSQDVTRVMINMTWACQQDIDKHSLSIDDRWWSNEEASEAQVV